MLSRSVRLQRCVAIAIAMVMSCFTALSQTTDSQSRLHDQHFGRAGATHDQCLIACNGSTTVLPAAPMAKSRLTVIPTAVLGICPQTPAINGDGSTAVAHPPGAHRRPWVGITELRL